MKILKLALTIISVFKSINYNMNAGEIITIVDASKEKWDDTLIQIE